MKILENSNITISNSKDTVKVFQDILKLEDYIDIEKEHFYVMHLDIRNKVKMIELVTMGILDSSIVHPRETFRRAIIESSASIIIAHNHPSGGITPSDGDIKITKQLMEAGKILDIRVLDHIIFTNKSGQFYSFQDKGEMRN